MDDFSALTAALSGRCPACGEGKLYASFLKVHPLCPHCHVRFERWEGSWTIPTVMGYASGAAFAILFGGILLSQNALEGNERPLIFATMVFTLAFYPICKNFSLFMLWRNGFITVDPPTLVPHDPATADGDGDGEADRGTEGLK